MVISKDMFAEWFKKQPSSVTNEQGYAVYDLLSSLSNGEALLNLAIARNLSLADLEALIVRMTAPKPAVVALVPEETAPVATATEPVKADKPSFWLRLKSKLVKKPKTSGRVVSAKKSDKKPSKKLLLIGGGVVLVLILAVVAVVFLNSAGNNKTPDITFVVEPTVTTGPSAGFAQEPLTTGPLTVSEESEVAKVTKEEKAKSSFQMHPPASIPDLFTSPDWNFLIFVLVLIIMVILTKQERFAEQQQTDWRIIRIGYILVLVGIILANLVATFLNQVVVFLIGVNFLFDPLWIQIFFLGSALVAFVAASITGKIDWTPVSVGLFTMGGLLVAFNPTGAGRTIGYAMIIIGVVVHVIELATQQGTAGALGMVLVGLPIFIGLRFGFAALFGLIGTATLPTAGDPGSGFVRWLALAAYDSRILWSTVLALMIGFALASVVASLIFPPIAKMLPQSGQLVGNLVPTEDTPRIDAVVAFLMGVICFWLIVGHF